MRAPDAIPELEIVRAYVLVQLYADAIVPQYGLDTYELHLLYRLRGEPPMSQAELGRRILRDPMNVSRLVRSLEERGLAIRVVSPTDARARLVTLTPKAEALVSEIFDEIERGNTMRGWSKRDLRTLVTLLRRTSETLREACDRAGIATFRSTTPANKKPARGNTDESAPAKPSRERVVRADDEEPLPRAAQRGRR